MVTTSHTAREVAHVALRFGRLMLINGADAGHVHAAVADIVEHFGYRGSLLVLPEGLLISMENEEGFSTKVGPTISGMTVNMRRLAELHRIRHEICKGRPGLPLVERQLDEVEHRSYRYPAWLVTLGMGLTAAALARLFGGGWAVFGVCILVGVVTQFLRQHLSATSIHPVAGAAIAAFGGGLSGALVMKLFPGTPPTLCLVAAGMILVPGVPLINGVRDTLGEHSGTGIARLTLASITTLSISLGLFLAARLAGDELPVDGPLVLLPVGEDLVFSALAGMGFAVLFNVPARAAWACVLCALIGHGLRTALSHAGLDLPLSSMAGAFCATLVARAIARQFWVPAVTFAYPGVVSMIPGSYAFRAGIGGLSIMSEGPGAGIGLIGDTIALAVTAILVTAGIAIGLCLAMAVPLPNKPMFSTSKETRDDTLRPHLDW